MNNKNIFDNFENSPDDIIEKIEKMCAPLSESEEKRIYSIMEKKCNTRKNSSDFLAADEVKGVDVYMRPKWYKPVKTAAACLVLVGGIGIGAVFIKSIKNYNDSDNMVAVNSYEIPSNENNTYNNLVFSDDFILENPDVKEFETFKLVQKKNLSPRESYEYFDKTVDEYYGGIFSDAEKEEQYMLSADSEDGTGFCEPFVTVKDDFFDGKYDNWMFLLLGNKGCVQMFSNGALQTLTGTAAFNIDENRQSEKVGMYSAKDNNEIPEEYHIPIHGKAPDTAYQLIDEQITLSDAVDSTIKILSTDFNAGVINNELKPDVTDAWVVDMGNGIYGYHLWLTTLYNDIRLDTNPTASHADMSTCKNYNIYPGYAFMIEKDKIDSVMAFGWNLAFDIEDTQAHRLEISFDEAKNKLATSISENTNMTVSRAEFVYVPYKEDDYDSDMTVEAAWKFIAKNSNDNFNYVFYVNALTSEVDYYKY